ncbi:MAG: DegT/DnrJ/EryC1/StrS family aminotransferase [Nitrospirae bacterium]|nr:DegT/DnrJ/EryC1/StrS family aminotransferase [Nitrospirota bacterium]
MTTAPSVILHSRPTVGSDELLALTTVIGSGHLAQGPRVEEFEQGMAALLGLAGGVAVSSGTAALEVALKSLGVAPGDEVILPSYVCAAPWLAVVRVGALPKIVDIEPDSYAIDPAEARKALSSRTSAIIVPHLFGLPADLTALQSLGVPLIEDCAQTLGATEAGRPVGTVGAVTVCSFYATKLLCTGEGGMVLSNDRSLLERARALREYDEEPVLDDRAFNYKMTDLQAALGLSQLRRFPSFLERRSAIAATYRKAFASMSLGLPIIPPGRSHRYYRFVVRLPREAGSVASVIARLEQRGVQCRAPVFRPLHRYRDLAGYPVTEEAVAQALSLPIYPSMTEEEVTRTIQMVSEELSR